MQRQQLFKIIVGAVALGVIFRMVVVLVYAIENSPPSELPDEIQYWSIAQGLAHGEGLRDELGFRATRMPLYPGFLSLFVDLPNGKICALLTQAALAALACGFTSWLAYQLIPLPTNDQISSINHFPQRDRVEQKDFSKFYSTRFLVALTAGLLVAADPFLVYYCRFLLTENIFIVFWCAFLACGWRTSCPQTKPGLGRGVLSGALFSLGVYVRPSSVAFLILWSGFILIRRRCDKLSLGAVLCLWITLALLLCPWAARNRSLTGRWTWLTNRGGISLYDGVHPQATGASSLGKIKQMPEVADLNEVDWNNYFVQKSGKYIRTDSGRLLGLAATKFQRTWSFWPNAQGYQRWYIKVVGGAWTVFILCSAAVGIWSCRKKPAIIVVLLLPALYFTALHVVFVGSLRYRLPAMPFIEILSAIGILALLSRKTFCADLTSSAEE